MTLPLPPQTSERVPTRRRWGRLVLPVLLAGIGALGWHIYTGQRAVRQLREAGFEMETQDSLGERAWAAAHDDWRKLFLIATWEGPPEKWRMDIRKAGKLRNLDALAPALRRVNPSSLVLDYCHSLQNVDGLKGLTALRELEMWDCPGLQNVDGLKGLTSLKEIFMGNCRVLQNVDGLEGLTSLTRLRVEKCHALRNVDALKGLTSLQHLDLNDCPALQDVNSLGGHPALSSLFLSDCVALRDVNGFKELTGLGTLGLNGCRSLEKVDSLRGLTQLRMLNLRGCTKLPREQVAVLKEALPHTLIDYP